MGVRPEEAEEKKWTEGLGQIFSVGKETEDASYSRLGYLFTEGNNSRKRRKILRTSRNDVKKKILS